MTRLFAISLIVFSVAALLTGGAHAQIDYDPAHHAYFVTGDASIANN